MGNKSQRILMQMGIVSLVAILSITVFLVWKFNTVMAWAVGDIRPLVLNGIIFVLFLLGSLQVYRAIRHYQQQEDQINDYIHRRGEGWESAEIFETMTDPGLLVDRYQTIRDLYNSGAPIDHGAISAIMIAEESLHQSFPRFVNNVLILTGVFGTVSSLIFALVGAGDLMKAASPDAGMGLLLLGMNTALTTTATAIVCYFFFTFFFHRLTDVQTWVFSQVERAALLHMVPEFSFETDTVNRQTKLLVEEVKLLVQEMRVGLGGIEEALRKPDDAVGPSTVMSDTLMAGMEKQHTTLAASLTRLDDLHQALVDGFRLNR